MKRVLLTVVLVTAAYAYAFQPDHAGDARFWWGIGLPYAVLAAIALYKMWDDGTLVDYLVPKWGDLSLGLVTAAGLLLCSFAARSLLSPDMTARQAWLFRIYIQMGDLSENADYHKAKEDQGFLEGRIQEIEAILRSAVIIEKAVGDTVSVGSHVTIQEEDFDPETFYVVGAKEADPRNGKISNESPFGKALLDHKVGDMVEAEAPGGKIKLKILKIE